MRKILHVDMDAFFASIEISKNPSLKGKPIAITNSMGDRGVVSTASYEARKYGIHSAMPLKKAKRLYKNLIVIRGNFSLYNEVSHKIMEILSGFTDKMEVRSIDEAYLDVTETEEIFGGAVAIGKKIKSLIKKRFNLTCSVGISYNKLLAKIATELSKPDGLLEIKKEDLEKYYYPLPIEKIPGIGPKSVKILKKFGIERVSDLRKFTYEDLVKNFKPAFSKFLLMIREAKGNEEISFKESPPKSISSRVTLNEDTTDIKFMESILSLLSEEIGNRLRRENYLAKTIKITIRYSNFKTVTHQRKLSIPINSDSDILKESIFLLRERIEKKPVRLLGVTASSLMNESFDTSLFPKDETDDKFLKTIDKIKEKFGERKILLLKSIFNSSSSKK